METVRKKVEQIINDQIAGSKQNTNNSQFISPRTLFLFQKSKLLQQ